MQGVGYQFHNGHIQKKEHEVMKQVALLDKDELQITIDGMDIKLSSQPMTMMLMQCTNLVVSPQRLHNHYAKNQKKKAGGKPDMMLAEQIIHQLTTKKSMLVVYLVMNVSVGYFSHCMPLPYATVTQILWTQCALV
jgi:hypothetical protein